MIHSLLLSNFRCDLIIKFVLFIFSVYALPSLDDDDKDERKLRDDEMPLLVQLNWHKDDREGRFLLRRMDEKTYVS